MGIFSKKSNPEKTPMPLDKDSRGRALFEEDIIAFVQNEAEKRRNAQRDLEWQWCLNGNFYSGNQFCEINPYSGGVKQQDGETEAQERQAFNRIAPIIETRLANLNTMKYGMAVLPRTDEPDDDQKARISTRILRYAAANTSFDKKRQTVTAWAELCGTAFIFSFWDTAIGEEVGTFPIADGIKEGDINYILLTPYEVLPESLYIQDMADQPSVIIEKVIKAKEARELYGIDHEGATLDAYTMSPIESGTVYGDYVTSFALKNNKVENAVRLYIYMEKPSGTYKNGRMAIVCGGKLVHYGALPYSEIPIAVFKCKEMPGQFFGRSVIQDMIPLQRSYNGVKNKIHDYIKTVAANPMLVPEGAVADMDELAENGTAPGNIIEYDPSNGKPEPYEYAPLPAEVINEASALVAEMEYVAGVSSLMVYGKTPSGVTSGTAIDNLRQIDSTRLSVTGDNMREAVKTMARQWLNIYKTFATGYRVFRIGGGNDVGSVFVWHSEDINSFDVTFDTENELKHSAEAQKKAFTEALNTGAFGNIKELSGEVRRRIREAYGIGTGFFEVLTLDDVHIKRAKNENIFFGKGKPPAIDELDDDELHESEHIRYVLQREFEIIEKKSPEYASLMREHINSHRKNKVTKELRRQQEKALLAQQQVLPVSNN